MQNQIRLPDKSRLLQNTNLRARLADSMAEIASRIEMRGEAAGVDVTSSISTVNANSGTIHLETVAENDEVAMELIDEFLDEEAV